MKEKMIKRKLLSFLLTLAMVMGLVPWISLTARAETTQYNVWVGGTRVTSENANDIPAAVSDNKTAGTASYNAETKTLTLDNYVYSGDCTGDYEGSTSHTVIYAKTSNSFNPLQKIVIKGNVSITQSNITVNEQAYGICNASGFDSVTIEGSGDNPTLTVKCGDNKKLSSIGINIEQNLVIKDCIVDAESGNAPSGTSIGICSNYKNLQIINSTVSAIGKTSNSRGSYGIRTENSSLYSITIDNKSTVTAIGNTSALSGRVKNSASGTGYDNTGMSGDGTTINANAEGTTYDYKAIKFLPPPPQIESGAGTDDNPYIIKTAEEMAIFRDIVMGENRQIKNQSACAKLGNDITLTGNWTPIGTSYDSTAYKGTFNGEGHTIKGLSISSGNYGGIFGAVFEGTVKNLIVEGSINIENSDSGVYVGGVAGAISSNATIENCVSKVAISVKNTTSGNPYGRGVGGIVGLLQETSTVSLCHNEGVVSDAHADSKSLGVGGIAGASMRSNSTIINCYNTGSIIKNGSTCYAGGIIGFAYAAIQNCHSYISGSATEPIGYKPSSHGTFENLYYLATATGEADSNGQRALSSTDFESLLNMTGFESTVWTIRNGTPKYPVLKCQIPYVALDDSTPATITLPDSHSAPVVGDTLAAVCDATDLTYQWYRGNTAIDGATSSTYTVTTADLESAIKVVVTQAVDESGTALPTPRTKGSTATSAVVKKTPAVLTAGDARTNAGINYEAETVTPVTGYEISSSNTEYTQVTSLTSILDGDGTPKIYVRTAATTDTAAGSWVEVTLTARPEAPTAPATENATNDSTLDGKIKDAFATWEYKNKETGKEPTNWAPMTEGDVTVKSGTYQIRVKATDKAPHGKVTEVTVGSKYAALTEANKPTISVSDDHNPPVIGDTLTATTTATDIIYQWYRGGTPITDATGATYILTGDDVGKAISVEVIQTKKPDGSNYAENARPTQSSAATPAVVKKTPAAIDANTAKSKITIDYAQETVTPLADYEVSVNGTTQATSPVSLTDVLDGETPKIFVRTSETNDTSAGGWVAVTLTARPAAPSGFTTENATNETTYDGKLTGVSDKMEYSADGTNWTPGTGTTIENLQAGTYKVRIKATEDVPHGRATEVTVGSKQIILTDSQKPTARTGLTYNSTEQALINAPTATLPDGAKEMRYVIGTDVTTAPTDGWSTSIPTGTAAGTYYVWYKAIAGDSDHSDSAAECITVTIKSQGSGSGSTGSGGGSTGGGTGGSTGGTESYTIPVINENTVNVKTEITGGTAVVGEITQKDLDKIVDTGSGSGSEGENTSITVDISQAQSEVTSVELSKETTEKLAEAVGTNDNLESVEIKMSKATVELDGAALTAISEQAEGSSIKLVVEDTNTSKLNDSQQESLKQFASASPFEAYFESDGKRIHELN